jgi:hypothetical protein
MNRRSLPLVLILLACASVPAMAAAPQTLFNFVRPTDAVQVQHQDSGFPQVTAEPAGNGEILRRLEFGAAQRPSLRLSPPAGSWDWSGQQAMSLRLQNGMDWDITLEVGIESADGKQLVTRIALPAGPAQTLLVPLAATSPRAQGMRAGPPMPWTLDGRRVVLAEQVDGELDARQISAVTLSLSAPDVPQQIFIGRFGVDALERLQGALFEGMVDGYGQYSRGQWPEKIRDDQQLRQAAQAEAAQLANWQPEAKRFDRFGGLLGAQPFEATGFFYPAKRDGRWYLVTPEGNPFYSLGVNTVSASHSRTYIEGRESMFAGLPGADSPLAAYYGEGDDRAETGANRGRAFASGRWFDFYQANLQRSYPDSACASKPTAEAMVGAGTGEEGAAACQPGFDAERWTRHSLERLQGWGFNTIGNWSDASLGAAQRMAYTQPLSIRGDYATIDTGVDWWGGMPDPFDPRFAMATERAVAISARDHRNDPWLIGYFADNELAWAGPGNDAAGRYALAYATLRLTTDVPAKRAFLKQLRDKYRNHEGLSRAWGIRLTAWELMEDPGFQAPLPSAEFPAIEKDLQAFQQLFADTYFKTIADSLEWHAPNHLLLGGRFASSTPEAIAACVKYCDVLSFNFYTAEPQHGYDFETLRALDKPVLVSEFHFGSRDRGPFWGGVVEVRREEDRGPAYARFLKAALAEPSIIGAHWFQYLDQPVTGRLLDGENGHFGLVGITDRPYGGFISAVRRANQQAGEELLKMLPAASAEPAQAAILGAGAVAPDQPAAAPADPAPAAPAQ